MCVYEELGKLSNQQCLNKNILVHSSMLHLHLQYLAEPINVNVTCYYACESLLDYAKYISHPSCVSSAGLFYISVHFEIRHWFLAH